MDADLRVIHLVESAPPCEQAPCPTYGPADKATYVLEINAGAARQAGIGLGERAVAITEGIAPADPRN